MITLEILSRMPEFAPVREEMRAKLAIIGARNARYLLENRGWDADNRHIIDWLFGATDKATLEYRIKALHLVIDEWESES